MLPFSPCMRQWNVNEPVVVIATGASYALSGGMSPDSYMPLSNVAECTIESLFLKFTYGLALTATGFGEYTRFVMNTVIGLPLLPSPLPDPANAGSRHIDTFVGTCQCGQEDA